MLSAIIRSHLATRRSAVDTISWYTRGRPSGPRTRERSSQCSNAHRIWTELSHGVRTRLTSCFNGRNSPTLGTYSDPVAKSRHRGAKPSVDVSSWGRSACYP
uniref:Uncharacterized protein n=1 Tax=Cannabis sativa TaxID=3483 RepID=A0A803Q3A8_CANSA